MDGYFSWGIQKGRYPLCRKKRAKGYRKKQRRVLDGGTPSGYSPPKPIVLSTGPLVDSRNLFNAEAKNGHQTEPVLVFSLDYLLPTLIEEHRYVLLTTYA